MKFSEFKKIDDTPSSGKRLALVHLEISPLSAYLTLKSNFGEAIDYDDDRDKVQWEYVLERESDVVSVYDWKLDSCSLAVYPADGNEQTAEKLASDISKLIITASKHHKGKIKALCKDSDLRILDNPYRIYRENADELLESFKSPNPPYGSSLSLAALFLYISAFEGFMNVLYEFYLNPVLRDDRLADRLGREQIDIKVRLAPIYCDCFKTDAFDHTTDVFRKFHSLMNMRNTFIHANIGAPLRSPVIFEDDFTFIESNYSTDQFGIPNSPVFIQLDEIENVKSILDDMVEQILDSMRPRYRHEFEDILEAQRITVQLVDGEMLVKYAS